VGALFCVNLGGYDLWPPDEPRFGEVAREMLLSGDPLALRVNDEPYKEKPPLLFWLISLASLPSGEVTALSARLPSALAGMFAVAVTFFLAKRLYGVRVAWWSGIVLATLSLFWWEARSVRTDMVLTAGTTAMLYTLWCWEEQKRQVWLVAFYVAMAAALLAKGPPALIFPLLTIAAYYWGQRAERRRMHWVFGVLLATVPVSVWFVLSSRGTAMPLPEASQAVGEGMGANLFRQTVGRFFLGVSHAQWPWYFIEVLPLDLFPWTLFLPWTLAWVWRNRRADNGIRLLLAWIVPALIFFSVSIGKRSVYLLPLYPALSILVARSVLDLMEGDHPRWRRNCALVWAGVLTVFALAPVAVLFSDYRGAWHWSFVVPSVIAAVFAANTLRRAVSGEARGLHKSVATHFALLAILGAFIALPALNAHKSARSFTAPLRALTDSGAEYRLYSVGFSREEYIFYAKHFHKPVLTDLLPLELPYPVSPPQMAKLQRSLKRAMVDAVAAVPVADSRSVTDTELAQLRAGVEKAMHDCAADPKIGKAFVAALHKAVASFNAEFEATGRAFFFVQEEDWRWLLPLNPHLRAYPVMDRRKVGSRIVLLIANRSDPRRK
jgi:4-amino-4-deoxy-L-arabinose transferase-like glycosyltransferase